MQLFCFRSSNTTFTEPVNEQKEKMALVICVGIIWFFLLGGKDAIKEKYVKEGVFANHTVRTWASYIWPGTETPWGIENKTSPPGSHSLLPFYFPKCVPCFFCDFSSIAMLSIICEILFTFPPSLYILYALWTNLLKANLFKWNIA